MIFNIPYYVHVVNVRKVVRFGGMLIDNGRSFRNINVNSNSLDWCIGLSNKPLCAAHCPVLSHNCLDTNVKLTNTVHKLSVLTG